MIQKQVVLEVAKCIMSSITSRARGGSDEKRSCDPVVPQRLTKNKTKIKSVCICNVFVYCPLRSVVGFVY